MPDFPPTEVKIKRVEV